MAGFENTQPNTSEAVNLHLNTLQQRINSASNAKETNDNSNNQTNTNIGNTFDTDFSNGNTETTMGDILGRIAISVMIISFTRQKHCTHTTLMTMMLTNRFEQNEILQVLTLKADGGRQEGQTVKQVLFQAIMFN